MLNNYDNISVGCFVFLVDCFGKSVSAKRARPEVVEEDSAAVAGAAHSSGPKWPGKRGILNFHATTEFSA